MKFQIHGVHLLESAFSHMGDPFAAPVAVPEQSVEMQVELSKAEAPNRFVVIMRLTTKNQAQYAFSVRYAVLLSADPEGEAAPDDLEQQLLATGASTAFPYIRELVSNLSSRARLGAVWLNPVDFEGQINAKRGIGASAPQTL